MARQAGVERAFYISHLGADRSSAYPVLKAKAIAEHFFLENLPLSTIIRTGPVFGPGDQFTTGLARLVQMAPGLFIIPGDGHSLVQPIWIEDFAVCLLVALEDAAAVGKIIEIGGGEYLTFRDILETVMRDYQGPPLHDHCPAGLCPDVIVMARTNLSQISNFYFLVGLPRR